MRALKKIYLIVSFFIFYLLKLIQANIYLAYDILTPKMHTNPGFVWIPLRNSSDIGILLLCNLVSMTPGTLSVEVNENKKQLLVHCLYKDANGKVIADIEEIQDKIIKLIS